MTSPAKPQDPRRSADEGRPAGPERPPRRAPPPLLPPETPHRGQRLSERPRSQPGLPAAHLRVSPPPSAPTVHPAGPGGGRSDAAPTGPQGCPAWPPLLLAGDAAAARFAPAPGSRGSAEQEGAAAKRPPLPDSKSAPEQRLSAVPSGARLVPAAPHPLPPGSHSGSGGPVAITAQQLTRRRSGARSSSSGGGGARQGGSSRGPGKPRENCPRDGATGTQPWARAMLSVSKR